LKAWYKPAVLYTKKLKTEVSQMKRIFLLCLVLSGLLLLASCGGNEAPPTDGLPGTGIPIVMYTNHAPWRWERLMEHAAEYGFDLTAIQTGGGATMERLIAEQHNPIAHIVYGLNSFLWHGLLENDLMHSYVPSWADSVLMPEANNPDGFHHFADAVTILLVHDAEMENPPTDWFDLWQNPEFHGRYMFETQLGGATTRKVISGILTRFPDPNGHLGIADEGWENLAAFYRYGVPNSEAISIFARIADQQDPVVMAQMGSSGIEPGEESHGVLSNAVVPSIGVPYSLHSIGIVAGNTQMEESIRFLEWFTPEVRAYLHANDPVERFGTEAGFPMQDIDWDFVAQNIDAWVEHIYLHLLP
jgi:iron(III) transport system substrate-binding protein